MQNNIQNQFKLEGKTALVTGGAGLLGKYHVALLETGAKVIVVDINDQALTEMKESTEKKFLKNLFCFNTNICSENSIKSLLDELIKRNIDVNILINNAAIDPKVESEGKILNASRFENFSIEDGTCNFLLVLLALICAVKFLVISWHRLMGVSS